jgi:Soluble lytic murein transglycosylase and related regulatory proteins (some contain LysM/invasin domains)
MSRLKYLLLLLPLLVQAGAVLAQNDPDQLRAQFKTALLQTTPLSDAQTEALKSYPLYPYLEYQQLERRLGSVSSATLQRFIDANADTPLAGRLLFAWARHSGKTADWPAFNQAWQQIQHPDTRLRCLHAHYLLDSQQQQKAWEAARSLWRVGHSQPDECDPVFDAWLQSDHFSQQDALERQLAALHQGRPGLASYAARFISDTELKQQAQLARRLYDDPARLAQEGQLLSPQLPNADQLLLLAVNRLARRDLEQAITLWLRERDRLQVPSEPYAATSERLGVRLAKRFPTDADAEALLAALDPNQQLTELTGWRIRLALVRQDWAEVLSLIETLDEAERRDDRWRYWKAIALERRDDPGGAALLRALARERSFYGFLAAQRLGTPYQLNHTPLSQSEAAKQQLAQQPAFVRMRELLALERYYDARSEWNLATSRMPPEQIHLAAHLAQDWGWYDQGIRGAISSRRWDDMQLRFPNPLPELFQRHARSGSIDPAWAVAIARQESAFWLQARSRAGARGLMQLMPATARATAKRHAIPLPSLHRLSEPDTNIRLGTAYLSEMAQRFEGNLAYASAAYNAGPYRVSQWLEARGELPLDIWIETIPFDETRRYVQNVLAFRVIYERLADRPVALFSPREFKRLALQNEG